MTFEILVVAFGLLCVVEGVIYGVFTKSAQRMAFDISEMPEDVLRMVAVAILAFGVFVIWLIRGG